MHIEATLELHVSYHSKTASKTQNYCFHLFPTEVTKFKKDFVDTVNVMSLHAYHWIVNNGKQFSFLFSLPGDFAWRLV